MHAMKTYIFFKSLGVEHHLSLHIRLFLKSSEQHVFVTTFEMCFHLFTFVSKWSWPSTYFMLVRGFLGLNQNLNLTMFPTRVGLPNKHFYTWFRILDGNLFFTFCVFFLTWINYIISGLWWTYKKTSKYRYSHGMDYTFCVKTSNTLSIKNHNI